MTLSVPQKVSEGVRLVDIVVITYIRVGSSSPLQQQEAATSAAAKESLVQYNINVDINHISFRCTNTF